MADEGNHHLGPDVDAGPDHLAGGLEDGPDLHAGEFGEHDAETDAAGAQHRVGLLERSRSAQEPGDLGQLLGDVVPGRLGDPQFAEPVDQVVPGGEELVERRVDEPDDHRETAHRSEEALEVPPLVGNQGPEGGLPFPGIGGHDHPLHMGETLRLEEHVLRSGQADAFRPVSPGSFGIGRVVGVGPDAEGAGTVGPGKQLHQPRIVDVGHHGVELPVVHPAGRAVDRDPFAFADDAPADRHRACLQVDVQVGDAHHGRLAELAGDEGRMARPSSPAGQDPLRSQHAVDVVGLGLRTDHDDLPAFLRPAFGQIGVEGDDADCRPRGDVEAGGDEGGVLDGCSVELWVEEEVHLVG